jgi:hypothetical protein
MLLIQCNPYNLRSLDAEYQTEEVCLVAVQRNGYVLAWVHNQTKAVVDAAVNQQPGAKYCVKI